jgi:phenylalanyl-tRNA synthetase beta chain
MKLSYKWLQEYVDLDGISPEELADRLTRVGLAVDAVMPRNQGVEGVVVGEVVACEKHPNADRLNVCKVDAGSGEIFTIVCGAPNVATGQKVITALPGSQLPGGKIKKAKLRGVESSGMLCSASEIGLDTKLLSKEQTEGLYLLPSDVPVGSDVVQLLSLDDYVLEVDLTPNRSDCLSMRGFAYEVAAIVKRTVNFGDVKPLRSDAEPMVSVRLETENCARYEAQVVASAGTDNSPLWMQMRLMAMGIRPINLVVDVTNYVMLEWGQPLHAFDLEEVHARTIVVRQGADGETMTTLDGSERVLTRDMVVISDVDRAIGIAGVMGGQNSEIQAHTKEIVLESAVFDPISVRRTGQLLGLRSEAQQRFEKGIDPAAVRGALDKATLLLQDLAGASPLGEVVSVSQSDPVTATVLEFSPNHCNQLLGTRISESDMLEIFVRLGFLVHQDDTNRKWLVTVPARRPDITLEADLIEEVGRLFGYDQIPSTLVQGSTTVGVRTMAQNLRRSTRNILVGLGMNEVFTYAFTHPSTMDALRVSETSPYRNLIPLLRPLSEERTVLRTHLLPSLGAVAKYNLARGIQGGGIFEISRVYIQHELPLLRQPDEQTQWAGLWFGQTEQRIGEKPRPYDFYDAKGVIESWFEGIGCMQNITFHPTERPWLHPGRSAEVRLNQEVVGSVGELYPDTASMLDVGSAIYAEFNLELISSNIETDWQVVGLPKYPSSRRDLSVLLNQDVSVGALISEAMQVSRDSSQDILENCDVFDVYVGKGIDIAQKSVAFALTYRADDRTLTDDEISILERAILDAWTSKYGAVLRTS